MFDFNVVLSQIGFTQRVLSVRLARHAAAAGVGLMAVLVAGVAEASTSVVTTTLDTGPGSLREAINTANASGPTAITFGIDGVITLTSALPVITNTVSIDGSGHAITVSGANQFQVLFVNPNSALRIQSISIANGNGSPGGGIFVSANATLTVTNSTLVSNTASTGGAIFNAGTLTVISSTLVRNTAYLGGGIWNNDTMTMISSTLVSNSSTSDGGGINNYATLTVTHSTLLSNTADYGGGISNANSLAATISSSTFLSNTASSYGGGIENEGTLTVTNSTLVSNASSNGGGIMNFGTLTVNTTNVMSNTATVDGGGIFNYNNQLLTVNGSTLMNNTAQVGGGGIENRGTATVNSSTLISNMSAINGGGIYNDFTSMMNLTNSTIRSNTAYTGGGISNAGTLYLINSTLVYNTASTGGGGGGLSSAWTLSMTNTIIANSMQGGDCRTFYAVTGSYNLIKDSGYSACALTNGANGNIVGSDPLLGPLQLNGNSGLFGTLSMAPLPGSPAINAGTNAAPACPAFDQRGFRRPLGGKCDIGAVEWSPWATFLPTLQR